MGYEYGYGFFTKKMPEPRLKRITGDTITADVTLKLPIKDLRLKLNFLSQIY